MEIMKIPIVDYFKYSLDAAYERGFTWVMCLIARDADAEKTYNQIKKYWDSFHDITGKVILFIFAGKQEREEQSESLLWHEAKDYRALTNTSIRFVNKNTPTLPHHMYPKYDYETDKKNKVAITHTQSISELRDYLGLSEKEIPSLVFIPTNSLVREKKVVVQIKDGDLYKKLKGLIESFEEPIRELQNSKNKYANLNIRLIELNRKINKLKGTKAQRRFNDTKHYLDNLIISTKDDSLVRLLKAAMTSRLNYDRHSFDSGTRINLNQYHDLLKQYPNIESDSKIVESQLIWMETEKENIENSLCEENNRIIMIYDELTEIIQRMDNHEISSKATIFDNSTQRRFKVAFSFPGEHRTLIKSIADKLAESYGKDQVLYDEYHRAEFARPNLDTHLQKLYRFNSDLIVVFICDVYQKKKWCGIEWRAIRDLLNQNDTDERIMFVKCGTGSVDGVFGTIDGYVDSNKVSTLDIVDDIIKRLDIYAKGEAINSKSKEAIYSIKPNLDDPQTESQKLIKEAIDAQYMDKFDESIKLIRKALSVEESCKSPCLKTIAYIKYILVCSLTAYPRGEEMNTLIDDVLSFKDIGKDKDTYCQVLLLKAQTLLFNHRTIQARSALQLAESANDKIQEKTKYFEVLGNVLINEGNIEQAVSAYKKGMDVAMQLYIKSTDAGKKKALYQHYYAIAHQLGLLYCELNRPDLAVEWLSKAIQASEKIEAFSSQARTLIQYAGCLVQMEEWEQSLECLNKAYNTIKDSNDYYSILHSQHIKADLFLRRNDEGDPKNAVKCLKDLLDNHELQAEDTYSTLLWLADILAENLRSDEAENVLKMAEEVAIQLKDSKRRKAIDKQRKDIKQVSYWIGDRKLRHIPEPSTKDVLTILLERFNCSEVALERLSLMWQIGGAYRSMNDLVTSKEWFARAAELAEKCGNLSLAARALIAKVDILFQAESIEMDNLAEIEIIKATHLTEGLPAWDIRSRIILFKGMLAAQREQFKEAHNYFLEAKQVLNDHNIRDQILSDYIDDYTEICEELLSLNAFTDFDFEALVDEVDYLDNWFPKYKNSMRSFLWYNRHEDIEKLIASTHGSIAFMISDSSEEIQKWTDNFHALFDITSFCSQTDYFTSENWHCHEAVPIPQKMCSKYFNIFAVLDVK